MTAPMFEVRDLRVGLNDDVHLLTDVSFQIDEAETLAVVGESGCGKSLTSLAVMRLLPDNLDRRVSGQVIFEGRDLLTASEREMRRVRGNDIAMVFQDALSALNPLMTVEQQIAEGLIAHAILPREKVRERVLELLAMVRIPDPVARLSAYPHELSGGMRQRIVIAMAMSCSPKLIVADEPTTALDVTVQAQILDILKGIQQREKLAMMLITHDLGVVRRVADRMIVMYAGSLVEAGPVREILERPSHPYTVGLMQARPHGNFRRDGSYLSDIPGMVPAPVNRPKGCQFAPRCPRASEICVTQTPPLTRGADGRGLRCFHPMEA